MDHGLLRVKEFFDNLNEASTARRSTDTGPQYTYVVEDTARDTESHGKAVVAKVAATPLSPRGDEVATLPCEPGAITRSTRLTLALVMVISVTIVLKTEEELATLNQVINSKASSCTMPLLPRLNIEMVQVTCSVLPGGDRAMFWKLVDTLKRSTMKSSRKWRRMRSR